MSGIAAIVNFDGRPVEPEHLERMIAAMPRRGRDGIGRCVSGGLALAHLHAWTTPEEVGEEQPVRTVDPSVWLAADARLDNRDELVPALGAARDTTDAQLIIAAYRRWGLDFPRHLVGDFAFVLWDERERTLLAVRDPVGLRQLVYLVAGETLVVATTCTAVAAAPERRPDLNLDYLREFIVGDFERTIVETPFVGVMRVPPGHFLVARRGSLALRRYRVLGEDLGTQLRSESEYVEAFRETFFAAVRAQARTIGPVGLMVSGGLDSSSIACTLEHLIAAEGLQAQARLYSCVFAHTPSADERPYLDAVVAGCPHITATLIPADDLWGLKEFGEDDNFALDEPELSLLRAFLLAPLRRARADGCVTILTGIGGDHVLGGGPYHSPLLLRDVASCDLSRELLHFARYSRMRRAAVLARAFVPRWPLLLARRLRRRLQDLGTRPSGRGQSGKWRANTVSAPRLASYSGRAALRNLTSGTFMTACGINEQIAAHAGVEIRCPFLDWRIVDLGLRLPPTLRFRDGLIKRVLREALVGVLVEKVRSRTKIVHFSALSARGLRDREWGRVETLLSASQAARLGLAEPARALDALRRWCSGSSLFGYMHFGYLLATEAWLRAEANRRRFATDSQDQSPALVRREPV